MSRVLEWGVPAGSGPLLYAVGVERRVVCSRHSFVRVCVCMSMRGCVRGCTRHSVRALRLA